ncbi:hypothetical protein L1987_38226 [Smallanthus sonchifolius]|uniref:Uncharacterized protein n=1 Tax=Smallanthus sonchifolius TaxID=185202 RepID=A0ACB9HJU3_9ASTR|nr:hypothetical protein L1987_38226 [Smallanthus sonchifolius]
MVLDLRCIKLDFISEVIALLVHLRYLAIWYNGPVPSSICDLWSLQTLIIRRVAILELLTRPNLMLPNTISNLVNLRHLKCNASVLFPRIQKPMNLLTISEVILGKGAKDFLKGVPSIKKLKCLVYQEMKYDFRALTFLETLKIDRIYGKKEAIVRNMYVPRSQKNSISFPSSLKKLELVQCHLPWSSMSEIQSLPQLEVLELLLDAFVGPQWDAGEEPFQQLNFLKLRQLDITQWEASNINFPCLKRLQVEGCIGLDEIPLEIGCIPTLEHIIIKNGLDSSDNSGKKIQEEQQSEGNFDLKITVSYPWWRDGNRERT